MVKHVHLQNSRELEAAEEGRERASNTSTMRRATGSGNGDVENIADGWMTCVEREWGREGGGADKVATATHTPGPAKARRARGSEIRVRGAIRLQGAPVRDRPPHETLRNY